MNLIPSSERLFDIPLQNILDDICENCEILRGTLSIPDVVCLGSTNDCTKLNKPVFLPQTSALDDADIIEELLEIMDEFVAANPSEVINESFRETLMHEVGETYRDRIADTPMHVDDDHIDDLIGDMIGSAAEIFLTTIYIPRCSGPTAMDTAAVSRPEHFSDEIRRLNDIVVALRKKPQPEQRTAEWYKFRHTLITASSAHKAFGSQAAQNQLIYEKCTPLYTPPDDDVAEIKVVNISGPMHWGQKYEPVSILIYEAKYGTTIEEFGCIKHDVHDFIGASPDGINVDMNNSRYGRMLEVKNIVNREITGIPKKEYWVQMQLQMEVCGLDECDFLETKFMEYDDIGEFNADTLDDDPLHNYMTTRSNKQKGIILHFYNKATGAPVYMYKPIDISTAAAVLEWRNELMRANESVGGADYTFIKTIYWRMETFSCVLVIRNREWFAQNVGGLKHVWDIILKERVTGCDHRAPNKRRKKDDIVVATVATVTTATAVRISPFDNRPAPCQSTLFLFNAKKHIEFDQEPTSRPTESQESPGKSHSQSTLFRFHRDKIA